jgi:hypothetical protein
VHLYFNSNDEMIEKEDETSDEHEEEEEKYKDKNN